MSLMGTLAKIAIGVVVAKSVGGMMSGGRGSAGGPSMPRGFPGGLPGGSAGKRRGETGLEDMMGDIFGTGTGTGPGRGAARQDNPFGQQERPGRKPPQSDPFGPGTDPVVAEEPGGGGLGDVLEKLGRGGAGGGRTKGGGLNDVLGELTRNGGPWGQAAGRPAGGGADGGLGDLLGSVLAGSRAAAGRDRGFGDLLNESLRNGGEPDSPPAPEQEAAAALMLQAMIQAAKSDGRIDAGEQKRLTDQLGSATPEEMDFVRALMRAPIDIAGLCQQVPDGLQPQIYAMSLAAIDFDSRIEAQYMQALAEGLGLSATEINGIHRQMGIGQAAV